MLTIFRLDGQYPDKLPYLSAGYFYLYFVIVHNRARFFKKYSFRTQPLSLSRGNQLLSSTKVFFTILYCSLMRNYGRRTETAVLAPEGSKQNVNVA